MKRSLILSLLFLGVPTVSIAQPKPVTAPAPLPLKSISNAPIAIDDQILRDRKSMISAIDHSLKYLETPKAIQAYAKYPVKTITRDRVVRSLRRFRQLLSAARSEQALSSAIAREFVFYQSIGKDNQGTVAFTGYFEPVHTASRKPTAEYRYPLYVLPTGFSQWKKPHPTRLELEGADGLQSSKGKLRGSELVWMRDRLEAFLIQVQGSARLNLTDGTTMTIGVAGLTDQPYTGIGRELVKDGKLKLEDLNLPNVLKYFEQNPKDLNVYLPRNRRFVFFRNTFGAPALGSLGVPVTADRSIATDKSLMPPGALALIQTQLPILNRQRQYEQKPINRFMLDQDTGGAIIGAGRVDIFTGTGTQAGSEAGLINATGQLYYPLLKR
ncbi:murein transglycosylase A [Leptolyngbya sp. NIES-2104]|uniref:murein transglycosylase A n=1 Tax=Leptolyngbya sp. NIES-2104 TaxID=1552121 RepID=UPI0006ECCBF6|nr:MltA domain-containing protein [Leptolyngbya sp. NIES-2104]GAP93530.1 membrane-bound lytic murein transglycosylase A precursor [Leptolyngbya sp. NIES-2104]